MFLCKSISDFKVEYVCAFLFKVNKMLVPKSLKKVESAGDTQN